MRRWVSWGVAAALASAGCVRASLGPKTIPIARMDYNAALSRSWDEDLLLNLVRLRYRDSPLFVDVSSVTSSYTLTRNATIGATVSDEPELTGGVGLTFTENPIISYTYLRGEEFAQRMLSPLAPGTLAELSQSGWSFERLLLCCVQSINGIENAIAAAGPTPDYVPAFETFQQVATLFRRLQIDGQVMTERDGDNGTALIIRSAAGDDGAELRRLLGLDPAATRYEIVAARHADGPMQIALQGRSLLAVMFFLSQSVDAPESDRAAGRITSTRDATGSLFDWSRVVGAIMHVRTGDVPPNQPAVQVAFRGHWFWIVDNDLTSKSTLALLRLLLFLKSGDIRSQSPLLTIPTR
jgi:flavin-binding protein dodecin